MRMGMDREILDNFRQHTFYHGTSIDAAEAIARHGFRVWFQNDEGEYYTNLTCLGNGCYMTCDWRIALWFGPALFKVTILPGTRLLNSAVPPDDKVVEYLRREFGHEVLNKAPWKIIPSNKQLRLPEVIALFRYHYWYTWEEDYGRDHGGSSKWPIKRNLHARLLRDFRSVLVRYGFDGYGNPSDHNGIVVFREGRVVVREFVAEIQDADYGRLREEEFGQFQSIDDVKTFFHRHGSPRAKQLAEHIAATDTNMPPG